MQHRVRVAGEAGARPCPSLGHRWQACRGRGGEVEKKSHGGKNTAVDAACPLSPPPGPRRGAQVMSGMERQIAEMSGREESTANMSRDSRRKVSEAGTFFVMYMYTFRAWRARSGKDSRLRPAAWRNTHAQHSREQTIGKQPWTRAGRGPTRAWRRPGVVQILGLTTPGARPTALASRAGHEKGPTAPDSSSSNPSWSFGANEDSSDPRP